MNDEITEYLKKQSSTQKAICRKLIGLIRITLPGIKEEKRWGVPVFGDGKFYVAAMKDHVNIGFAIRGLSVQELKLFEGSGKTMRHIKIASMKDIDETKIVKLIKLIDRKAVCESCKKHLYW